MRALLLAILAATTATAVQAASLAAGGWVGAWQGAPAAQPAAALATTKPVAGQTLRQRMTVSVGGRQVRVVFTNAYGSKPLVIGAASLARSRGGAVDARTIRPLSFGGKPGIVVPVGAPAVSDPVDLEVAAFGELSVSLFLPRETAAETYHRALPAVDALQPAAAPEAVLSAAGNFTLQAELPGAAPAQRLFVSRLDVLQPAASGAVVVLGTTRTVGEDRWPALLARRLTGRRPVSVVDASMVANALRHPYPGGGEAALARFERDVLMVPGVTHVVLADAINDIGQAQGLAADIPLPTVEDLADAYRQLAARARSRGVKVIAATVMPFAGVPFRGFYSPEKEAIRQGLNQWIRGTDLFDGVIDLDALVRDPADPQKFRADLEVANHFSPNAAGERRIADAIDLRLFR